MYYVEVRPSVRRASRPKLVPLTDIHKYTGFRSAFSYSEQIAQQILESGTTKGLRGASVYCDCVFIDFDNKDPSKFVEYLRGAGLGYEWYNSGNRSDHFHIPCMPIEGAWVPAAVKQWIKIYAPESDTSFVHPAGMYRLPGTYHPKNPGKRKELIESRAGSLLVIEEPAQQISANDFQFIDQDSQQQFYQMLLQRKGEGHRRPFIWRLAVTGSDCGFSFETTLKHIRWWNSRFCDPPHPDHILVRQCEYAYNRR